MNNFQIVLFDLPGTTTPGQSESESNVNEGVFHTYWLRSITHRWKKYSQHIQSLAHKVIVSERKNLITPQKQIQNKIKNNRYINTQTII